MNIDNSQKKWQDDIGHKLRKSRKSLCLSLNDLSRLSGVAVPTLSHIENGNRDVKLSSLVRLTNAMRINLSELFTRDTEILPDTVPSPAKLIDGYDLGDE